MASSNQPSGKSISRRSLLEWLGSATVLALGSPLIHASCASAPGGVHRGDGSVRDRPAGEQNDRSPYPFQPGTGKGPPFEGWGERTVDPQDLAAILASWRLRVEGMVTAPRTLSFEELAGLPRQSQVTDFHCVEGWSVDDVPWDGVHLSHLFELVTPAPRATHVTFHTLGGKYNESLPLSVALEPRTILGYGVAGATLPLKHGFPVRLVAPRLLGYKNAKYVERIELTDHAVNGFWVAAGYPYAGEVPAARLRPGKY